jgi:ABC-type sugar transport system permease subunit
LSEHSTFELDESPAKPAFNPLKLLSLFLLLPAMLCCATSQAYPAVDTFMTSRTEGNLLQADERNVGMENYERLFEDRIAGDALTFTMRLIAVRVLIIATIPLLIGLLVGVQPRITRMLNRACLSVIAVTLSPVILGVIWFFFLGRTWDFDRFSPSPFDPLPDNLFWGRPAGARNNLNLLDAVITLGAAVSIGSLAYMAVARGRALVKSPILAGVAVWLVGVLLAIASFSQTFDLSRLLTNGGPAAATMTMPLFASNNGFLRLNFGYASAQATLEIVFVAILAILIWAVLTGFNLRMRFVSEKDTPSQSPALSAASIPLILLLGLPVVGLMLWGLWLVLSNGGFQPALDELDWNRLFSNSLIRPWIAIWFVQIPLAYLVGLTLGFFRPLGRIGSSILFLPFLIFAMIPTSALMFDWFDTLRESDMLDNLNALTQPFLFGGLSLIVFKLYFDGAHDAHAEAVADGENSGEAFLQRVILPSLPVVVALGAGLSLLAASEFLWPFVVLNSPDSFTATITFARLMSVGQGNDLMAGSALFYGGIISLIFLPVIAGLNIFVLDRLALLAGEMRSPVAAEPEEAAPDETVSDTSSDEI